MHIKTLQQCPLFEGIKKPDLKRLRVTLKYSTRAYPIGTHSITQDIQRHAVGIVDEGELKVEKFTYTGHQVKLNVLKAGDIFGFASMKEGDACHPTTITCHKEARIVYLRMDEFIKLLSTEPILLKNYVLLMSEKINFLNQKIDVFTMSSARDRIYYYFEQQLKIGYSREFHIKDSYEGMAEYLDISRATLFRELKKMADEGLITKHKKMIHLLY